MDDKWSKKLPDDRTVVYTSKFTGGDGGVITAELDEIVFTRLVQRQMTREEIEARFATLPSQPSTHRHSRRLYMHVQVRLRWRLENQSMISEETETVVVNAHGALFRLDSVPLLGQEVTLENISAQETQEAIVVFLGQAGAKERLVFWSLSHPDAKE